MRKKFELVIKIFIGATFFVPLILAPDNYIFPFIVPKILWFRSLALLTLGGYMLLLASHWQEYKARLTPVNMAVGLFFASFAISTFVGVDWYKSLWDNHERMLGLFTLFHYTVYYFIVTSIIKEWRDWKWLLRVFLLAGMIVMIIGGMQKNNPEFLLNRGSDRVSATLGNAIYFSGYGLFLLFIGLLLAIKEPIRLRSLRPEAQGSKAGQAFWFWYAVVGSIFGLLGIFWGGTKGTLLGLIVACLILFAGYLLTVKGAKKIRLILTVLLVLGLAGLGLLFVFRKNESISKIPVLGNLLNSSFTSGTGQTRAMAWQIAIEAWKEKPILGWGPNNYYYAFNKFYKPEFLGHGWGETWFDNAHSAIFNTLAVQGGVGLLLYFALFFISIYSLGCGWKKGIIDKHIFVISSAFLAGHFIHNATVFENPTSYLYFFFFLAFVNSQFTVHNSQFTDKKVLNNNGISIGLAIVVALVVLLLIYSTDINPARANKGALQTIKGFYSGSNVIDLYKNTVQITSPHIDDIRSDFARSVNESIPAMMNSKIDSSKIKEILNLALQECQKNRELHPLDIRVHLQQAQLNSLYTLISNDANYLFEAEKNLVDALEISPKRQQIQYMLAMVELQLNKPQEAVRLLEESIANYDKIGEGWARLIYVYSQIGQKDKAAALLEEAKKKNISFDDRLQGIIDMALPDNQKNK